MLSEEFCELIRLDPDRAISLRIKQLRDRAEGFKTGHNITLALSGGSGILGFLLWASGVSTGFGTLAALVAYFGQVSLTAATTGKVKLIPFLGSKSFGGVILSSTQGVDVDYVQAVPDWQNHLTSAERVEILLLGDTSTRNQALAILNQTEANNRLPAYRRWQESLLVGEGKEAETLMLGLVPPTQMLRVAEAAPPTQLLKPAIGVFDEEDETPAQPVSTTVIPEDEDPAWTITPPTTEASASASQATPATSDWAMPTATQTTQPDPPRFYRQLLRIPLIWIKGRPESHGPSLAALIAVERLAEFGTKAVWIGETPPARGRFAHVAYPEQAAELLRDCSDKTVVINGPESINPDIIDAFTLWQLATQSNCLVVISNGNTPGTLTQLIKGVDRADIVTNCKRDDMGGLVADPAILYTRSGESKQTVEAPQLRQWAMAMPQVVPPDRRPVATAPVPEVAPVEVATVSPQAAPSPGTIEFPADIPIVDPGDSLATAVAVAKVLMTAANVQGDTEAMVTEFLTKLRQRLDGGDPMSVQDVRSMGGSWLRVKGASQFIRSELAAALVSEEYRFDGQFFEASF